MLCLMHKQSVQGRSKGLRLTLGFRQGRAPVVQTLCFKVRGKKTHEKSNVDVSSVWDHALNPKMSDF